MDNHAIVLGGADWPRGVDVLPGAHVAVLSETVDLDGFFGRRAGYELRDTILVLSPHGTRFILLFRKPVVESTVAEQVLATGTGGINIDACRVRTSQEDALAMARCNTPGSGRMFASSSPIGTFTRSSSSGALDTSKGRWPPNVLMVHGSGCKRVKGSHDTTGVWGRSGNESYDGGWVRDPKENRRGHTDSDGLETVAAWECQEDCPVRLLDEQTGELKSGIGAVKKSTSTGHQGDAYGKENRPEGTEMISYGDSGGASRFFPQFKDDYELVAWIRKLLAP